MIHIANDRIASLEKKKYIHVFENKDNNCLIRALTYSYHIMKNKHFWRSRKKLEPSNFERYALDMCNRCGVEWNKPVKIDQLAAIEEKLETRIILLKFKSFQWGLEIAYHGCSDYPKKVYILITPPYDRGTLHCQAIRDPEKLLWSNSYRQHHCRQCNEIVKESHQCRTGLVRAKCMYCQEKKCEAWSNVPNIPTISCRACGYSFLNAHCLANHYRAKNDKTLPLCQRKYRCFQCYSSCNHLPRDKHRCNYRWCAQCKGMFYDTPQDRHYCYMSIAKIDLKRQDRIIVYDCEAAMDSFAQCDEPSFKNGTCQTCLNSLCNQKIHVPLVIASFSCCEKCRGIWNRPPSEGESSVCNQCGMRCPKCMKSDKICEPRRKDAHGNMCGARRVIFYGKQCINQWLNYLIDERRQGYRVLAHNSAGYDHA